MNAIQQFSLKLQLGIDPKTNISAKILRGMWLENWQDTTLATDFSSTPSRI